MRLYPAAARGRAEGPAEPAAGRAPRLVRATDAKVWFPIKRGVLKRTVGHVKAVDGISLRLRAGHTLASSARAAPARARSAGALLRLLEPRARSSSTAELQASPGAPLRPLRRRMQIVFQDPYGSLSPRLSVGQIVGEGLKIHRLGSAEERRRRIAGAERSRPRSGVAGPLSARVLGRPAPADRHRPGALVLEAGLHRARRADQRARYVGAGTDRRAAARACSGRTGSPTCSSATT